MCVYTYIYIYTYKHKSSANFIRVEGLQCQQHSRHYTSAAQVYKCAYTYTCISMHMHARVSISTHICSNNGIHRTHSHAHKHVVHV